MEGYQEVNEINLIDLIFYCLKRWRWIVVCMAFLAIIAGVYKYQATITENQMKREEQAKRDVEVSGDGEIQSEPIVFENPVSSAVIFAAVGMIGGACLVCLIFCMSYIMGGKLQDMSNFQQKFGMPLLGVVRKSETKKKMFGFVDRWICRLEEGPCAKISRNEQIKIAAVNIQSAINRSSKEKMKRVMVAGTIENSDVMELYEQLTEEIESVSFSEYKQIVFYSAALSKLEYYEGILFIEKKGESYERLIKKEKELAVDRDVEVLGIIIC